MRIVMIVRSHAYVSCTVTNMKTVMLLVLVYKNGFDEIIKL